MLKMKFPLLATLLFLVSILILIYAQDVGNMMEKFGNLTLITDQNATLSYNDSVRKCQSYGLKLMSLKNLREFMHAYSLDQHPNQHKFDKLVFNDRIDNNYVLVSTMDSIKKHNAILLYMTPDYISHNGGGQILCSKIPTEQEPTTSTLLITTSVCTFLCIASWLMIVILISIHKCVKSLPWLVLLTQGAAGVAKGDTSINTVRFLNLGTLDKKHKNVVDI